LLGTTPTLIAAGIPDGAFTELPGDDPGIAANFARLNRREQAVDADVQLLTLFESNSEMADAAAGLHAVAEQLGVESGDALKQVRQARERWRAFEESPARDQAKLIADAWCAAFVWPKAMASAVQPPTQRILEVLRDDPAAAPTDTRAEIRRLTR